MATDEMGHLWLQVLPIGPGDQRRKIEEALDAASSREDIPSNVQARVMLGRADALAARIRWVRRPMLEEAVRVDPKASARSQFIRRRANSDWRACLRRRRNSEAAVSDVEPDYMNARYNLAKTHWRK